MDYLIEKLKEKKLKVTPQRLAIYSILCNTNKHPNVENIYQSVEKTYPSISLATVYKTLDTLKSNGLLQEINTGEISFRYDANVEPHPHLICEICKNVSDAFNIESLDALKNEIFQKTDFDVKHEQLYFYGICKNCK